MNFKFNILNIFIIFYCLFKFSYGENNGNCEIDELTDENWMFGYAAKKQDDFSNRTTEDYSIVFHLNKITGVSHRSTSYLKYDVDKDFKILTITISDNMKNYEVKETDGRQALIQFDFQCETNAANLLFTQELIDVNNHLPTFNKKEYTFKIPIPWPQTIPITSLSEQIIVEDIDFSNRKIKFEIEENDFFEILDGGDVDDLRKQHKAILQPKKTIQFVDELVLEIKATDQPDGYHTQHTESAKIRIIPDMDNSVLPEPKFEEVHYIGTYLDDDTIKIDPIKLIENTYSANVKVTLQGDYDKHFKVNKIKNSYEISVTSPIDEDVWDLKRYTYLYIIASDPKTKLTTKSVITIDFPQVQHTTTSCPVLTTTECPVCPDCTTESAPTTTSTAEVTCPDITTTVCPEVTCPTEQTCPTCPDCTTESTVTSTECPKVTCPDMTTTDSTGVTCPACPDCTTESLSTCPTDCTTVTTTCPIVECPETTTTTECPMCPETTTTTECPLICPETSTTTQCPLVCPETTTTTECPVVCPETSTTAECPACPEETTTQCPVTCQEVTCTPSTETTTDSNTSNCPNEPVDPIKLYFPKPSEVNVEITTDYTGEISSKTAFVYPTEQIVYTINTVSSIRNFIEINSKTGVVTVKQDDKLQIIQNVYTLTVEASTKSKQTAKYQINLLVEYVPKMPFALTYRTLNENEDVPNFQQMDEKDKKQNCKFEILEIGPSGADKKWFTINSDGNIDANKILRDHPAFKKNDMKNREQVQLILQLNCHQDQIFEQFNRNYNSSLFSSRYQAIETNNNSLNFVNFGQERNWIYTPNIENRNFVMAISIDIIATVNHAPVFDENSPIYVGYPSRELAHYIEPPFVYKVHATDEDIGLDGNVSYYLTGTSIFLIHEKSGVIYPSKESAEWLTEDTQVDFTAMARDRNGEGLLANPLNILVKFLSQDEISLMKIDKAMQEDLDDIMSELSAKTEWTVRQLAYAVIPEEKTKTDEEPSTFQTFYSLFTTEDSTPQLTIYTYALGKDNEIISSEEFSRKIKTISIDDKPWNVGSVEPQPNTTQTIIVEKPSKENKGLLIAVIVLAIALALTVLGSVWFFIKRYNEKGKEILLSTAQCDGSSGMGTPPIYSVEDNTSLNSRKKSNLSIVLNDNLIGSTSDKDVIMDMSLEPNENPKTTSTRERKKSIVTFNDNVEEIDIQL